MSKHYSVVRLGDITSFRNGLNFNTSSYGRGCLLIGVSDFGDRHIPDYDSIAEINPVGIAKEDDFVQKGDILFVRSNGNKKLVGRSLFIKDDVRALYSGFCIRARIMSNKILPDFFAYYTKSPTFKKYISAADGTNINNLNQSILSEVKVPAFSIGNQQKIAALLSGLDDKIELNNRINTELEAMAKTVYDYWFVQFDFPNSAAEPAEIAAGITKGYKSSGGKMVYDEVLKREIPEGWRVTDLSKVNSELVRGISPKYTEGSGVQVINQRCIRNNTIDFSFCRLHDSQSKPVKKWVEVGDILVNSTGVGTLGRVAIVKRLENSKTTADSHVTIVRANTEFISPAFLGFTLASKQQEIEQLGEGSTGQTELSRENLGKLQLLLPNRKLQNAFESIVEPLYKRITINEKQNHHLSTLRDWLLPMLMNGQVSVTATGDTPFEAEKHNDLN